MSFIQFAVAAVPVAVYFILIGALRLRTRPLVTTGWRDTLTLGIAASGLIAIGPMQLFFPVQAAERLHSWVWLPMLALYVLGLLLILLSCKPRLIAYGLDEVAFQDALLEAAKEVDEESAWNGEVLTLRNSAIQLAIEPSGSARVQQVVHVGLLQNLQDWIRLERAFVKKGNSVRCPRSWAGWPFVIGGAILLALAITPMISNPQEAVAQLRELLMH